MSACSAYVGYVAGLGATIVVMNWFQVRFMIKYAIHQTFVRRLHLFGCF